MQQSPVILDLCLRITQSRKSRDHRDAIVFKMFFVHMKTKRRSFQIDECFGKVPLRLRISVDDIPSRRNKAAFSSFSGVIRTGIICANETQPYLARSIHVKFALFYLQLMITFLCKETSERC